MLRIVLQLADAAREGRADDLIELIEEGADIEYNNPKVRPLFEGYFWCFYRLGRFCGCHGIRLLSAKMPLYRSLIRLSHRLVVTFVVFLIALNGAAA